MTPDGQDKTGEELFSPTLGRLSFDVMFERLIEYVKEDPAQRYNLIIGTD